jgi:hypothetical protein
MGPFAGKPGLGDNTVTRYWRPDTAYEKKFGSVGPVFQDAQQARGQSGTITAVVNAPAKAGIELGENGSIFQRPKGKAR